MTTPAEAPPVEVLEETDDELRVRFPAIVMEGYETADGRWIDADALTARALPLSLLAQLKAEHGGDQPPASVTVGRLDTVERVPGPDVVSKRTGEPFPEGTFIWRGTGVVDKAATIDGVNVADYVKKRYLRGTSADLLPTDYTLYGAEGFDAHPDEPGRRAEIHAGELAGLTLVPIPAYGDCYVELDDDPLDATAPAPDVLPDGLVAAAVPAWRAAELGDYASLEVPMADESTPAEGDPAAPQPCELGDELAVRSLLFDGGDSYLATCDVHEQDARDQIEANGGTVESVVEIEAEMDPEDPDVVIASALASLPDIGWFSDPQLDQLTPLTVTDDGRVFGHLAGWGIRHRGLSGDVTPPRSTTNYAGFLLHAARVRDGDQVRTVAVGNLTAGTGHADMHLSARQTVEHYDRDGAAVAQVTVGEDAYGIWYAGALLPDVDELRLRRFMSCGLSGDWRRDQRFGSLELCAALSVPVPGFPVPRARVASGAPQALVAAGALVPDEVPTASGAVVLDYDTLAEALASRLDAREVAKVRAGELAAAHTTLVAELDEQPAVVAALLADVDDAPARMEALLADLDGGEAFDVSQMPEQLKEEWLHGEIATRIAYGTPGQFERCQAVAKEKDVPPGQVDGMCSNLIMEATGKRPGQHGAE